MTTFDSRGICTSHVPFDFMTMVATQGNNRYHDARFFTSGDLIKTAFPGVQPGQYDQFSNQLIDESSRYSQSTASAICRKSCGLWSQDGRQSRSLRGVLSLSPSPPTPQAFEVGTTTFRWATKVSGTSPQILTREWFLQYQKSSVFILARALVNIAKRRGLQKVNQTITI